MRRILIVLLAAMAGCSPAPQTPPANTAAAAATTTATTAATAVNNCPAHATYTWTAAASAVFAIDASTSGVSCAEAEATLTIRDARGAIMHTVSVSAAATQALNGAESATDMQRMLTEWITPAGAARDSTGDLAAWAEGAPQPSDDGVPFMPAAGITRESYEALRAADAPMYCYELMRGRGECLAMRDGALKPLGVQIYAG